MHPMPRIARRAPRGHIDHVLNWALGRLRLHRDEEDFEAFRRVMVEAHQRYLLRILAYGVL